MAEENKTLVKNAVSWWNKQPREKKTFIIVSGLVVLAVAYGIYFWANIPDYKPLFTDLSGADASKIVKKLEDEKVPYKLEDNGTKILVPEKELYKQRIRMAGAGLTTGGVGFEMFDKMNFGMSEEERKINYQRALQTELERTIDNIQEVTKSRVHLVIPKEKVFNEEMALPKSSVYVALKSGTVLTKEQIAGIQNLVASSVERLTPDNVAVVSSDGKILSDITSESGISDKKLQMTERVENYYRAKIQSFLDSIIGINNSAVRVTAVLDFDKVEKARETYAPAQSAVRNEQITTQQPVDTGTTGATNSLNAVPAQRPVAVNSKIASYELNKEVERTVTMPGSVKQVSVAVVLNGKYDDAYISKIKESIAVASGLNLKKGDVIDVKAMEFKALISEEEKAAIEKLAAREMIINLARDFLPGLIIVLVAFMMTSVMISTLKKAPVFAAEAYGGETGNEHAGGNGKGNGKGKMDDETILKLAKENPKEAAKIIKAWLS